MNSVKERAFAKVVTKLTETSKRMEKMRTLKMLKRSILTGNSIYLTSIYRGSYKQRFWMFPFWKCAFQNSYRQRFALKMIKKYAIFWIFQKLSIFIGNLETFSEHFAKIKPKLLHQLVVFVYYALGCAQHYNSEESWAQ